jgi:alcohol dehydrogenase class IV
VVAMNVRALRLRGNGKESLDRYEIVARILSGQAHAGAEDLISWLTDLVTALEIPRLATFGVGQADIPALVTAAAKASSMKANPVVLTADECTEILREAL